MKLSAKLNLYQEGAVTTKIYADQIAIPYVILGIVGEVGEFMKVFPTPFDHPDQEIDLDRFIKEGGDVMWYLAATCSEVNVKMGDVIAMDISLAEGVDIYGTIFDLAELTKKYLRDEWPKPMSHERWEKVKLILNVIFNYVVLAITKKELDTSLYEILDTNYKKLQSRKDRGVLSGSGDNR